MKEQTTFCSGSNEGHDWGTDFMINKSGLFSENSLLARTPYCILCKEESDSLQVEDMTHFLLLCPALQDMRENFLQQFLSLSPAVVDHMEVSNSFLVCLVDPYSPLFPEDPRLTWASPELVYHETSRNFCFAIHNERSNKSGLFSCP